MANPYFVEPLIMTFGATPSAQAANPGTNMLNDEPDLVWRSASGTLSTPLVVATGGQPIDSISLLYSNLRSTDTVRVRGYDSLANANAGGSTGLVSGSDSGVTAAYLGAAGPSTKTIFKFSGPVTASHWRIDIVATGHPDNHIQVGKLVMGSSVNLGVGIDQNATRSMEEQSVQYRGPGYEDWDEYPKLPVWQVTFSWISDTAWRDTIFPFFLRVGLSKPVMFVAEPDFPANWQNEIVYGRFREKVEASHPTHDGWQCQLLIASIAP